MRTSDKSSRIDLGRLAAVAVFAFFMVINILAVQKDLKTFFPVDAVKCLLLAHRLLVAAFYVLVIALYFVRDKASATTRSFPARLIALAATFLPFLIPVLGDPLAWVQFRRRPSSLERKYLLFARLAARSARKSFRSLSVYVVPR